MKKVLGLIKRAPVIINGIVTNYDVISTGHIMNRITGTILKPSVNKKGYSQVTIYIKGCGYTRRIHRLVAEAFIPNPDNKLTVNHMDGDKKNNEVSNLEWMTNLENIQHAWETGLSKTKYGEDASAAKYTQDQVERICQLLEENVLSNVAIAKEIGVPESIVSKIKTKDCWRHISDEYDIPNPITNPNGVNHPASKYTDEQIHLVCESLQNGSLTGLQIAKLTGVGGDTISMILKGISWKHISSQYILPKTKNKIPKPKNLKIIEYINLGYDIPKITDMMQVEFDMPDRKITRELIYRTKRDYKHLLPGSTTIDQLLHNNQ